MDVDIVWVDEYFRFVEGVFEVMFVLGFVMGDFKVENFVIQKVGSYVFDWCISGLFDFIIFYFGDGMVDLIKMIVMYIYKNQFEFVKCFLYIYWEFVCVNDEE